MYTGPAQRSPSAINAIHKTIAEASAEEAPRELYHYTSIKVMDSILENAQLWASNIYYLNDAEEYHRGISYLLSVFDREEYSAVRRLINEIRDGNGYSSEGVFTISFSTQVDNLHQWITYSKEAGVCLGFDNDLLKDYKVIYDATFKEEDSKLIYGNCREVITRASYIGGECFPPEKMVKAIVDFCNVLGKPSLFVTKLQLGSTKNANETNSAADKDVDESTAKVIKDCFRLFASYCKDSAFSIEREYRAALLPLFFKQTACAKIYYYSMPSGVIRPYIKVGFQRTDEADISPLPIKLIIIGPAGNQQSVFDSVVHRVKYGKRKVWNYWENQSDGRFKRNFIEFVCGSLEGYAIKHAKKLCKNQIEVVFNKLLANWCQENDIKEDAAGLPTLAECLVQFQDGEKEYSTYLDAAESPDTYAEDILSYIRHNNYLSKEGIWIKKSQIAYVF